MVVKTWYLSIDPNKYIEYMKSEVKERKVNAISLEDVKVHHTEVQKVVAKFVFKPDRKEYKKLALKYHPDKGGDPEHFKILNYYMN